MKIMKGLAIVAGLCAASPALADGVMLEANGARAQERWGGELGLGYTFDLGRFRVRPVGGAFIYGDENGRYRNDTISGGVPSVATTPPGRLPTRIVAIALPSIGTVRPS